jgi:hypothetical protein
MSFTVQEARAAFFVAHSPTPHHVGGSDFSKITCSKNCVGAHLFGDARDLKVFRC